MLLLPVPRRLPQLCQPSDWLSACVVQGGRHTPSDLPPLPPSHTYVEYEDMAHEGSGAMIALNRQQWFDYHVESMRRATANLPEISTLRTTG